MTTAPTTAVTPPTPVHQWAANMLRYGAQVAAQFPAVVPDPLPDALLGATYYDAARVFYQIADYTRDAKWLDAADRAARAYRSYVLKNNGGVPGYWNFADGLAEHAIRTNDADSASAVKMLATSAAYAADSAPVAWTADAGRSREVGYAIGAYLAAERIGEPRRKRLAVLVGQSLAHLDQWCYARTSGYCRPFMVGLTAEALVKYSAATGDPRIVGALTGAADWLWETLWVPSAGAFRYTDVDTAKLDPKADGYNTGGTDPAPDLNLLIAPLYAWLWRRTDEARHRERAAAVFAGGVAKAYLGGAKQFNQNYRWSFSCVGA